MTTTTDSKVLSQARYTEFAQGYVTSKTHAKGAELDRLVEIAQPQPDWIVLDVATGGGHTALKFAPFVAKVISTDLTPKMLDKAEAFITEQGIENVAFQLADAEDLPFDDGVFDLVTCRIAPHHFPDAARFVREGARVLKAGGLLLVQDHVLPEDQVAAGAVDAFEKLRDPSHNRAFAESEWLAMFQAAGLAVEGTEQIIKRHDFVLWTERQGCTPGTVERLVSMMEQSSPAAVEWIQPQDWGTPRATFVNPSYHHRWTEIMKYKWLLFDADGTLFDYDRAEAVALQRTFEQFGHPFELGYAEAYRRINGDIWLAFEQGRITQARLRTKRFELLFEAVGAKLDLGEFSARYLQNLAEGTYLMDGAEQVLGALHGKVGLALITNGLADVQRPRFGRSTIGQYFSALVISEEVGSAKPDPAIFEVAFREMGEPDKEDVLIIGDSLTSDIKGGNNFGIDTCWFNPAGKPRVPDVDIQHEIVDLRELLSLVETMREEVEHGQENARS